MSGESRTAARLRQDFDRSFAEVVYDQVCLRLTREPERHSCRPSIDRLFESLAGERGAGIAACLLTGMGLDGAAGLLSIRHAGGLTIAQDEATPAIYGMPCEAVLLGAASHTLPLADIGSALAALANP